jgi:4-alpha-glucanotransferase
MEKRGSGILLHVTSLPSSFGIGDLGPEAYRFADFLTDSGQTYWQILPLSPTDPEHGNSPYHVSSAFACNTMLICPEYLVRDGWLPQEILKPLPDFSTDRVDYGAVIKYKDHVLNKAFEAFKGSPEPEEFRAFCEKNAFWLDDYALFVALKSRHNGKAWPAWDRDLRDRHTAAIRQVRETLSETIQRICFYQYLFFRQWGELKTYCNKKGICLIGDMPFYVIHDSADVWSNPDLFNLDQEKWPITVAGVPPDYFSETGQLWGNPVYRWQVLKDRGYKWWIQRTAYNIALYDFVRIDHFRGFVGYWEIPAHEENAVNGRWVEAPAWDFFNRITAEFPRLPIIAEDLGVITPEVVKVMGHFGFPGMKVLLFAFGDDLPSNPYAPHNVERNCLIYTGTHDNNTAKGWFENETTPDMRERLAQYIGRAVFPDTIGRELIRLAMISPADTAIFPIQDLLGLGEEDRMNRPATQIGNWEYRLLGEYLTPNLAKKLREMTVIYGRANAHA